VFVRRDDRFSTHVSVLDASDVLPKSAGTIFDADSDHGAARDMAVTVRCAARDQLVIQYPAHARVFREEVQANGVVVAYETVP
jgi:hypothetical protein